MISWIIVLASSRTLTVKHCMYEVWNCWLEWCGSIWGRSLPVAVLGEPQLLSHDDLICFVVLTTLPPPLLLLLSGHAREKNCSDLSPASPPRERPSKEVEAAVEAQRQTCHCWDTEAKREREREKRKYIMLISPESSLATSYKISTSYLETNYISNPK